jgi:pantoate kinase
MKTNQIYLRDNDQNNNHLVGHEKLIQQLSRENDIAEKIDVAHRFTLLLGFAQATLAHQYEKKHALSKSLFNQVNTVDLQNNDTKKIFHEMRLLQEEMNFQLAKVNRLTAELGKAEETLTELL